MDGNADDNEHMVPPTVIVWGDPPVLEITLPRPTPGPTGPFFVPAKTLRRWCCMSDEKGNELIVLRGLAEDEVLYPMVDGATNEEGFIVPPGRYDLSTESGRPPIAGQDDFFDGVRIIPPLNPTQLGSANIYFQGLPLSRRQMATLTTLVSTPELGADLMERVPLLERIRLRQVSPAMRDAVDSSLGRITKLDAGDLAGLKGRAYRQAVEWLVTKCPNLTKLSAGGPGSFFTDATLKRIAQNCKALRDLNVGKPKPADLRPGKDMVAGDEGIAAVAEHCKELRMLEVVDVRVTDDALVDLGLHAHKLEKLQLHAADPSASMDRRRDQALSGVTGHGVKVLAKGCRQLNAIGIPHSDVCDKGLQALADFCPLLHTLDITGCDKVTDAGMMALAKNFHNFRGLDIYYCKAITDASMQHLVAKGGNLEYLSTGGCLGITDVTLRLLGDKCPKLDLLSVEGCNLITDVGVTSVARHCPRLKCLEVRGCPRVTDASISDVAHFCKDLTHLDVAWCTSVTDASLSSIAQQCKKIKAIDITGCHQVSPECLAFLGTLCSVDC
eukprot:jgi/Mesvir1/8774/Mv02687-RA.1